MGITVDLSRWRGRANGDGEVECAVSVQKWNKLQILREEKEYH